MPFTPSCHPSPATTRARWPCVSFGGLGLGDLGELGLDGATLVVDALEALRLLVGLLEVVGEQKVERQLRVAHAARGVQARDDARS